MADKTGLAVRVDSLQMYIWRLSAEFNPNPRKWWKRKIYRILESGESEKLTEFMKSIFLPNVRILAISQIVYSKCLWKLDLANYFALT